MHEPNSPAARRHVGYPLSALFVLMAVCAVLLGMLTPVMRQAVSGEMNWGWLMGCTIASALAFGFIGAKSGLFVRPWYIASPICGGVGVLVGAACGPLLVLSADSFPALMAGSIGGAIVIVGIGLIVRLSARETE